MNNVQNDINKYIKELMIKSPFYGLFVSSLKRIETTKIELAAVGLNKSLMEFYLYINPDSWSKLSNEQKEGLLLHEVMHLTMFHLLTLDKYPNSKIDNIATDLEINQKINRNKLPEGGLFIEDFINKFPQLDWTANAGRDHYYKELSKLSEDDLNSIGISKEIEHNWIITNGEGESCTLTQSELKTIAHSLQSTIEMLAEEVQKSVGSLPMEIQKLISGFIKPKPVFNYKKYIRQFVDNSTKYLIKSSKIKENYKFPGYSKVVLKPKNRLLVLIDESGSVSEKELKDFLNEIHHINKKIDVEIRPFSTDVMEPVEYKGKGIFNRTHCGGTRFQPCVDFYNNSPEFNTCIIFTDGHAETPTKSRKFLLWVISSNGTTSNIQNQKFIKINN